MFILYVRTWPIVEYRDDEKFHENFVFVGFSLGNFAFLVAHPNQGSSSGDILVVARGCGIGITIPGSWPRIDVQIVGPHQPGFERLRLVFVSALNFKVCVRSSLDQPPVVR